MSDFLYPSDADRSANEDLDRVCTRLEEAEQRIEWLEAELDSVTHEEGDHK